MEAEIEKLSISKKTRSRQQHMNEARRIVRDNTKYTKDPNYKYFLKEVISGLYRGCCNEEIFESIRTLRKMILPIEQNSVLWDDS